jgi:5-formyltetrahydrofolate cyclo-ligase
MPDDTPELKRQIRRKARESAGTLTGQSAALSREVQGVIAAWDAWRQARTILAFLPLPPPALEVDLSELLRTAIASGRRVCLPRVDWASGTMQPAIVPTIDDLSSTRHSVRQPAKDKPAVPLDEIDLVLVPGLSFDLNGNRLGRGAGFYDRFLAPLVAGGPGGPRTCGVCFEAQLVDRIPTDPWDVPMHAIATECRLVTLGP